MTGQGTILLVAGALALSACSRSISQPTVDTNGITEVDVTSSTALPPPSGQQQRKLTGASDIARFKQAITAHSITVVPDSSNSTSGCTGGVDYTITIIRGGSGSQPGLDAYECGGAISGNIAGSDVPGFLTDMDNLLG